MTLMSIIVTKLPNLTGPSILSLYQEGLLIVYIKCEKCEMWNFTCVFMFWLNATSCVNIIKMINIM